MDKSAKKIGTAEDSSPSLPGVPGPSQGEAKKPENTAGSSASSTSGSFVTVVCNENYQDQIDSPKDEKTPPIKDIVIEIPIEEKPEEGEQVIKEQVITEEELGKIEMREGDKIFIIDENDFDDSSTQIPTYLIHYLKNTDKSAEIAVPRNNDEAEAGPSTKKSAPKKRQRLPHAERKAKLLRRVFYPQPAPAKEGRQTQSKAKPKQTKKKGPRGDESSN